jgi:hypothetical protein
METYNFKPHLKGDTFPGITFSIKVNDEFLDLTDAQIRMQLRQNPTHPVSYELSFEAGNIEISDAENGEFKIKEQIIDFPARNYNYDIQISWPDSKVKTYISGIWVINQDVTH